MQRKNSSKKVNKSIAIFLSILFLVLGMLIGALIAFFFAADPKPIKEKLGFNLMEYPLSQLENFSLETFENVQGGLLSSCPRLRTYSDSWNEICDYFHQTPNLSPHDLRIFFLKNFTSYKITYNSKSYGKFTGYYTAHIQGSLNKTSEYIYPVFGRPKDLISLRLNHFSPKLKGQFWGHVQNGSFQPYFERKILENSLKANNIILWANNLVDLHILHIQGSGEVSLPNGEKKHLLYNSNNGHAFHGIGATLKKNKVKNVNSMPDIRKWLLKNPNVARSYLQENKRFIFFDLVPDTRKIVGALGIPLIPKRSLAIDPNFIALGHMLWMNVQTHPYVPKTQQIAFAHDTGTAIKGPIRADYYWGLGEEAFQKAGTMNAQGEYYFLLPKKILPKAYFKTFNILIP